MAAGQSFSPQDHELIRTEMEKILACERFVNAKRISKFLRYVVEEALAGRGDRLKAFSIAQDVFGRDGSFDQQRDPIVRVEASRLRKFLKEHYESSTAPPALRIDIPKGGYAPIFTKHEPPGRTAARLTSRTVTLFGLAGLAILLALWFGWRLSEPPSSPEAKRDSGFLAVLPLSFDADDVRATRLAETFVDSTITLLARLPDLSVMAHASMMEFDGEQVSLRLLRDEFGVTHALRGGIETLEDELRLRIQLIDTKTTETIWSDRLEGNLRDVWLLQDELAANLLDALAIQLESVEKEFMLSRYTESAEALALYRQGLFLILPPSDIKRVQAAMQVFARVREIDPEFAGGYAGAAWAYALPVLFHNTRTPDENLAQALDIAAQAIEIDPSFGAGYAVLGFTQALSGEKVEALENAQLAAAIQPGDAFVQFLRAVTYVLLGIPEEAFAALDEAIRLNPIERRAPYLNVYSIARFANREYRETLEVLAENHARNGPRGPHMDVFRAAAHAHLGDDETALAVIDELNETAPDFPYAAWLESWLGPSDHLHSTLIKLSKNGLTVPAESVPE